MKKGASRKKAAPKAQETPAEAETGANLALEKAASTKVAGRKKGATKGQKTAKAAKPKSPKKERKAQPAGEKPVAREGTAKAKVIAMMQPQGWRDARRNQKVNGWQAHTIRGFVSLLGSKHGIKVESSRREDGARVYGIAR